MFLHLVDGERVPLCSSLFLSICKVGKNSVGYTVYYGGNVIMYPTLFPIIEGEKVLSSDFSTHLVPLQKHSLVVHSTCVRGAGEQRGGEEGEEAEEGEKEGMRKRRRKGRREEEEWAEEWEEEREEKGEEKGEEGRREAEGEEGGG